jgi:hypothetical protein
VKQQRFFLQQENEQDRGHPRDRGMQGDDQLGKGGPGRHVTEPRGGVGESSEIDSVQKFATFLGRSKIEMTRHIHGIVYDSEEREDDNVHRCDRAQSSEIHFS